MAEQIKEYSLFIASEQSWEKLPLTPLGADQFRLEANSMAEQGLFYHDIIEARPADGDGLNFIRRVDRSELRTFQFLLSKKVTESAAFEKFLHRVEEHEGYWEQIFGGILLVSLPRGSACRPKSELKAIFHSANESGESQGCID